jgi:integrase
LDEFRTSKFCRDHDLVDPITVSIATGLRRSELLRLRWSDLDAGAGTLAVCGKVIRETDKGLVRVDETKTAAGCRTISLPEFAIAALLERRKLPFLGEQQIIIPSSVGTLRDPNNFGRDWRTVRQKAGRARRDYPQLP